MESLTGKPISPPFSKAARHERLDLSSSTSLAECGDRGGFAAQTSPPVQSQAHFNYSVYFGDFRLLNWKDLSIAANSLALGSGCSVAWTRIR